MEHDVLNLDCLIPFLNWAGGKRWLTKLKDELFPNDVNRYIEPFLGSGAIYFFLAPKKAILSDINKDLIDTYVAIKEDYRKVLAILEEHHKNHTKTYYYRIRSSDPINIYSRAAKLIYLNRTCWNGLYRVNLNGQFNVPIGTKKNVLLNTDNFEGISSLLKEAELYNSDFEKIIDMAGKKDLIFVDPPYTVKHNFNNFIKYNEKLFSWEDQIRLRDSLIRARARGASVVSTNAFHYSIKELYDGFEQMIVSRNSLLAADSNNRGSINELIIKG